MSVRVCSGILEINADFNPQIFFFYPLLSGYLTEYPDFSPVFPNCFFLDFVRVCSGLFIENNNSTKILSFVEIGKTSEYIDRRFCCKQAKAIGMTKIAEETGLSRPSLYKALSDGAKLQFATIMKVLKAIGGQKQINPITA